MSRVPSQAVARPPSGEPGAQGRAREGGREREDVWRYSLFKAEVLIAFRDIWTDWDGGEGEGGAKGGKKKGFEKEGGRKEGRSGRRENADYAAAAAAVL